MIVDATCLQHCLTQEESSTFERDGYLVVENALDPDHTSKLQETIARLQADGRLSGAGVNLGVAGRVHHPDFLSLDQAFVDLLDHPTTFPKVWGILGWNIYSYHSHLGVTEPIEGTYDPEGPTYGFHQDSFPSWRDMPELEVPARLSLKIGFMLSDTSEPGRGNFWAVPGSHRHSRLELPTDRLGQPEGAVPICAPAGAAVYFDRRLFHAASPNYWVEPRTFLAYGYGYRWLRTKDEMTIPPDVIERSDPIRRQLLGTTTSENNRFGPTGVADAPLCEWLDNHQVEAPIGCDVGPSKVGWPESSKEMVDPN